VVRSRMRVAKCIKDSLIPSSSYGKQRGANAMATKALWESGAQLGAQVAYETVRGTSPSQFIFRTSPGYIYSTEQDYTHAILSFVF
jgi:hypothetical protein